MVRKKQTRKYGKIRKKKNYSLKRKKTSQFRKKRRQRKTKKIIGGFWGLGNPRKQHYWDHEYSEQKKTCWKDKRTLSTTDYNTCKRDAYLKYLKKKLYIEVKKYAEDEINKIKAENKNFNLDLHKQNIIANMTNFKNERQKHHAHQASKDKNSYHIYQDHITMMKNSEQPVNVTEKDIFNELKQLYKEDNFNSGVH